MPNLLQITSAALLAIALPSLALPLSAQGDANATASHAAAGIAPLSAEDAAANTVFTGETARLRGKAAAFKTGDAITPFALHDQDGKAVLLPDAFNGKYVMVSFIFTRCQAAEMCPAATAKMVGMQRSLESEGLADKVQLVSITFDPRYDTPEVMHRYAQMFGAKTDNYSFLTAGPQLTNAPKLTDALLRRFGILTRDANDTIVHTMTTSLIAPDGTLALQESGSGWQAETFLEHIRARGSKATPRP